MKIKIIIPAVCLFLINSLSAQIWMQPSYFEKSGKDVNFYDIQKAFNKWSEGKNLNDIKGWKRYKRWEWFYEQRVFPTGEMPRQDINWKELKNFNSLYGSKGSKGNSDWVSLSPVVIPESHDALSIHGMGRINCITFHPTDSNTFWVGASQGGVWKTTDGGQTWVTLTDYIPLIRISDIAVDPVNPDIMYIATGDIDHIWASSTIGDHIFQFGMGILKSTDGGITWDTTGLSFNLSDGVSSLIRRIIINPDNTAEIVAGGADGIYRSDDAGATWNKTYTGKIIDMKSNPLDSNIMYAASYRNYSEDTSAQARVLKSVDFGITWTELNTGIPQNYQVQRIELAIAPSDTNYVYALTCGMYDGFYALYGSTDAGNTWTQIAYKTGTNKAPNMLGWFDGWYFGLTIPGYPPDTTGQGTYDLTLLVDKNDPEKIYTGGVNMWGSLNGGIGGDSSTWNLVSFWQGYFGKSLHADQHCMKIHPLTGKYFVANDGGIFKTDTIILGNLTSIFGCINLFTQEIDTGCYDFPTHWTDLTSGLHITEYYRLGCSRNDPDIIAAGCQDNGTYMYNNSTWMNICNGDGMEAMIDYNNSDIIFATNPQGALNKSTDGGITFTQNMAAPINNAGEYGDWVTPYVMHPVNSDTIYTAFKNVWRSKNGGTTWSKLTSLSSQSYAFKALAVANSNPNYIYAAKPYNILRSTNGGTSWQSISAGLPVNDAIITYIAVSSEDPQTLWITFSGYVDGNKVYKSTNAGSTWVNISNNLPNVSANCIVHQAGHDTNNVYLNGLYVGTDIGVFYTNDSILNASGGWIAFDNGLPNVVVNELEIQYGIQKLRAATYGRGLWESPLFTKSYGVNIGIKENSRAGVEIYPNPNNGKLYIEGNISGKEVMNINLFSLPGNKVAAWNETVSGNYKKELDISKLPNSIYILQVELSNSHYTKKIVKQ